MDHYFDERLKKAYPGANQYCKMFHSETVVLLCRFACFVTGSLFGVFLIFTVWFDDDFALVDLSRNRSVTWWLGVFGGLYILFKLFKIDEVPGFVKIRSGVRGY